MPKKYHASNLTKLIAYFFHKQKSLYSFPVPSPQSEIYFARLLISELLLQSAGKNGRIALGLIKLKNNGLFHPYKS